MTLYRRIRLYLAGMSEEQAQEVIRNEWLATYEWALLRDWCIEYYGARCLACGRSPQEHGIVIHIDHWKPRRTNPWLAKSRNNLSPRCACCNWGKGNKSGTDWRKPQGYWRHLWLALKG